MKEQTTCEKHPDRNATAECLRYSRGYCVECLEKCPVCPDPEMFCRDRERCLVYYSYKEKLREERKKAVGE